MTSNLALSFWTTVKDGDGAARAIFDRHYSRRPRKGGPRPKQFVGPGGKMVLLSPLSDALFVWRKYISDDGQTGVNCAVFRNESGELSSELILAAERLAWERWPGERLFTYVDPGKIRSKNPGFCFKAAGWKRCGTTKVNRLAILEKHPEGRA